MYLIDVMKAKVVQFENCTNKNKYKVCEVLNNKKKVVFFVFNFSMIIKYFLEHVCVDIFAIEKSHMD